MAYLYCRNRTPTMHDIFIFSVQMSTSAQWTRRYVEDRRTAHVTIHLAGTSVGAVSVTMRITSAQQEQEASRA